MLLANGFTETEIVYVCCTFSYKFAAQDDLTNSSCNLVLLFFYSAFENVFDAAK